LGLRAAVTCDHSDHRCSQEAGSLPKTENAGHWPDRKAIGVRSTPYLDRPASRPLLSELLPDHLQLVLEDGGKGEEAFEGFAGVVGAMGAGFDLA